MKSLDELTKEDIKHVKIIVLDVDGVLVPRGTKIKQVGNRTCFETKKIKKRQIEQIKKLHKIGYKININSGRSLFMLKEMFRDILSFISLTYENGSATWSDGKVYQHVNSFREIKNVMDDLRKIKHRDIKGFEPKEFIITIHCKKRIGKIENTVNKYKNLYWIWNDEAYDVGVKKIQTKAVGLRKVMKLFKLKRKNVLVSGDNYNDREMIKEAGISVSADRSRLIGDFYVHLNGKFLPADSLMQKIIHLGSRA
jgi:HAD superfamily hydrolase (TIGR01484 family)